MLIAAGRTQTAVQTVELPALDRTKIAFQLDAQPTVVLGPAQVPGGYFHTPNRVVRFSDGRVALATPWGFSRLHVADPSGKVVSIGDFARRMGSLQDICPAADDRVLASAPARASQYLGRVDMPAAFIVDDIGDDYIAGSYLLRRAVRPESDAIMDQSDYDVRVYRLRRG